ncbi:pirin-like protein Prn4 [Spathaspora passalidarum NRRL Y-27907]|uniref:Pirin-like protein Prn4 n=1 Tax=Spathaspora passalidarum (strain NRRL Y-27907 / 11-Y1) TaxID=619300 RepID=G3AGH5_SPAPN|nr:pirin-like protein Prn4 [Spathaspora passalidarum NRRL Y-27907]EGW35314.1 pirin-like protein Prn4 [Spathaspora passalidarum NRRL Y-27907]
MNARNIAKIVVGRQQAEGAGATVRRSIGIMNQRKFNPFLMFDHFSSSGTNGFPEHPHRGQETITLILHGAVAHEDFTGSKGILYAGDLQFMTAGRGVVHSEMPVPNDDGSPTVGLQLWVDLPDKLKDSEPRYRDLRAWEIPEVTSDDGKVTVRVISGSSHGVESVKDLAYTPINYYYFRVKAGGEFKQELQKGFNYFLYVLNGDDLILNNDTRVNQFENVFFEEDGDHFTGKNLATKDSKETEVEFVLIGGQKLDQEVVQYGPFVASSTQGIQKAVMDYQFAQNGFERVKSWRTLISDGVTKDMIEGPLEGNLEAREKMKQQYLAKKAGSPLKDEL